MSSTSIKFAGGVSAKDARALAEEMHVDPDFLQGMRKRRGRTDFACHIRNRTPRALAVSIPLGTVNTASQLTDKAFEQLIERNRRAYCVPVAEALGPLETPAPDPVQSVAPKPAPQPEQKPRAAKDEYVAGRGGQEHKYVQHLLRTAAHDLGFKAEIEPSIAGGSVDVAIEGRGRRIACEISITTDAEDEAQNAAKCLAAGFDQVWLIVMNARRKAARARAIEAKLGPTPQLSVLTVPEALAELENLAAEPTEDAKQVRGYTVKVRRAPLSPDEARRKREAVASVLAKSLRKPKE